MVEGSEAPPSERPGQVLDLLVGAARAREAGAFDMLARRISSRIMAYAFHALRDRGLAEEATQETLVRIYRSLRRYREGSFVAWSLTIARRVCVDLVERERRSHRANIVPLPVRCDSTESSDTRAAIEQALGQLPDRLRETFLLRWQGLSYSDISRLLGTPIGTVRSRLHEARRLLREALEAVHPRRAET